ncbi:MAG: hypothetical protein A3F89_01670 [Deltaproteobacteria bacterium RIFCSPLOWO2_12_FULL_50_11]|nr:MAG: hypothetical protein A3F89_01670 [Deltaproteobacteria bacterium RIFCSPLOWO2_12_FULL_50_11]
MKPSRKTKFLLFSFSLLTVCLWGTGCTGSSETSVEEAGSSAGNSYSQLSLGEVQPIAFDDQGDASLSFGNNNTDSYLMILNATTTQDTSYAVYMSTSESSDTGLVAMLPSLSVATEEEGNPMHDLMEVAAVMASESFSPLSQSSLQAATVVETLEVGSTRTFKVLNSLSSISSYEERTARLRYASDNIYIYVDLEVETANPTDLTDEDVLDLAGKFENQIMPIDQNLFGVESDINQDGHIIILQTPVLNSMSGTGGIVTGFFFPGDLYNYVSSNEAEIFYTLVPDSQGIHGPRLSKAFTLGNILPGVLAHEYQHMISFNIHVFLFDGATEQSWLNEALSHFAEDITGFGNENFARVKLFLQSPHQTPVVSSGIPTLAERGAAYSFIRYLYEQSSDGDAFISRLLLTNKTGTDNVVTAFQSSDVGFDTFSEFLAQWSIALALSEAGLTSDSRYNYDSRTLNSVTGNYQGLCIRCDAQDGRGTILDGPAVSEIASASVGAGVYGSAAQFIQITSPSETININGLPSAGMMGSVIHYVEN